MSDNLPSPWNDQQVISAEMLEVLPQPVQRYLMFSGVVGKPWIQTARVHQVGKFRMGKDQTWLDMDAVEVYTTNPPGFLWKARFKYRGIPLFTGRDIYKSGHGLMNGKLAGLFTIFNLHGPELDQGSMLRYLSELIWLPTAYLIPQITWQPVDENSSQVTFTDGGSSVAGRMTFDDLGRPLNFITQRYRSVKDGFSLDTWTAPSTAWELRKGITIPVAGQVTWKLDEGDLTYWDGRIGKVEYNIPVETLASLPWIENNN